jgi:choline dehydrogenase
LNAPVIMMAEKIADDILGKTPLPADRQPYYLPAA